MESTLKQKEIEDGDFNCGKQQIITMGIKK